MSPETEEKFAFASDNCAGMCPEAMEALAEANRDAAASYGDDRWTKRACDGIREIFETDCTVFFCFTGTAANSMAIGHLCASYHSVLCHEYAHIETDECGGPEFFTHGTKVLLLPGAEGRIAPEAVAAVCEKRNDIHYPRPHALSLTQSTELGTIYRPEHLAPLSEMARRYELRVHLDGARFANAVVTSGESPAALTWKAGVDVLCFGGAKNGLPMGETVVFFDRELAAEFDYRCKQAGQLCSKMRFLAAPWARLLETGAWLRNAAWANARAKELEARIRAIPGAEIVYPVEANAVFVRMTAAQEAALHAAGWHCYSFIGTGGVRLMCSWNTRGEEIAAMGEELERILEIVK